MKKGSLIIDLRNQLPWHRRYISHTSTAMLWAAWLFLWRPLILIVGFIGVQKPHLLNHFLDVLASALEHGFIALLASALALWLWSNFASTKTVKKLHEHGIDDYAKHFSLDAAALAQSREKKILTVHHNADGKITHFD